jgi:thiol:disulfide interchange protein DsbD
MVAGFPRAYCCIPLFSWAVPILLPDLSSPLRALPAVFIGGVLTSLTPCIYPMIPITAAIVGGTSVGERDAGMTRAPAWRPAVLTITYVLGLALVYSSLGLFAGITGTLFGSVSTNPWLYLAMANLLLLAALAMLDVLPVRVPNSILERATSARTAGRASGAFTMGPCLVSSPRARPVMAAVLTWVSTTRAPGWVFSICLCSRWGCTLLVVVGLSSGAIARLPRAGMWMVWVKRLFALVMIGVAEYYLVKMGQLIIEKLVAGSGCGCWFRRSCSDGDDRRAVAYQRSARAGSRDRGRQRAGSKVFGLMEKPISRNIGRRGRHGVLGNVVPERNSGRRSSRLKKYGAQVSSSVSRCR